MKNRVITISREFGSGGRTIGKMLAEELGIPCYDAELIRKIVKESGFTEKYIKDAGEYAPGGFLSSAFSNRIFGPTNEDYLWQIQYKIITELAEKESCVIVGRCADYILRDRDDCLNVFIYAPEEVRIKTVCEFKGCTEEAARKLIEENDRMNHARYKQMTGTYRGDRHNRHLLIDSSLLGVEDTAKYIEVLAQMAGKL